MESISLVNSTALVFASVLCFVVGIRALNQLRASQHLTDKEREDLIGLMFGIPLGALMFLTWLVSLVWRSPT